MIGRKGCGKSGIFAQKRLENAAISSNATTVAVRNKSKFQVPDYFTAVKAAAANAELGILVQVLRDSPCFLTTRLHRVHLSHRHLLQYHDEREVSVVTNSESSRASRQSSLSTKRKASWRYFNSLPSLSSLSDSAIVAAAEPPTSAPIQPSPSFRSFRRLHNPWITCGISDR